MLNFPSSTHPANQKLNERTDKLGGNGIEENRRARKWTRKELLGRVAWSIVAIGFRYSPRLCWGWRRFLLKLFGAEIGLRVCIDPTARIFIPWNLKIGDWSSIGFDALIYNLGPIEIGQRTTISQRSHLCAGSHDYSTPSMTLIKAPIVIGNDVWICADAFVGPNISVGDGTVLGARSVAVRNIGTWKIAVGNPAVVIKERKQFTSDASLESGEV